MKWKLVLMRLARRLPGVELMYYWVSRLVPGRAEGIRSESARLEALKLQLPPELVKPLYPAGASKTVLIVGMGQVTAAYVETFLRKSFEVAGYRPVVLISSNRIVRRAYRMLGERELRNIDPYLSIVGHSFEDPLAEVADLNDLLEIDYADVRCGRYAASSLMRKTRTGRLDLSLPDVRAALTRMLTASFDFADAARRMLDTIKPDAVVFADRGYSPAGELFDTCMQRSIPAYTWNAAHRNNAVIFKRYSAANADRHPCSLSDETWQRMRAMPWGDDQWQRLRTELIGCYESGEWYGEVGTQLNKSSLDRDEIVRRLRIDPTKKTAVLLPHIFWDATFFWGEDLFGDYESWFNAVVDVAIRNDKLNWIIKIHPANIIKDARDGYVGEHSEISAIRKHFGELPPHIHLLPADTDISTLSLFQVMDLCLTVRGTVGIEAACFGIRVLTAGTGRYDHLGFTSDFDSPADYLAALDNLHNHPPMSDAEIELARRYAYGVFIRRPAPLETIKMAYSRDAGAELLTALELPEGMSLRERDDIANIARWIISGAEDFVTEDEPAQPEFET